MTQHARNRTMMNMRQGKIRLLVATDVAARGLDIAGISHVINFDLPRLAEDYVNRIGRTGRNGESGIAISFASHGELGYLDRIERYLGRALTMHVIPGLEPAHPLNRLSSGRSGTQRPSPPSMGGSGKAGRRSFSPRGSKGSGNPGGSGKSRLAKWDQELAVVYRRGR